MFLDCSEDVNVLEAIATLLETLVEEEAGPGIGVIRIRTDEHTCLTVLATTPRDIMTLITKLELNE